MLHSGLRGCRPPDVRRILLRVARFEHFLRKTSARIARRMPERREYKRRVHGFIDSPYHPVAHDNDQIFLVEKVSFCALRGKVVFGKRIS